MNARYYLPGIGRFVSADTIVPDREDPQSFNRYSYARNNPLKYTDPTGHYATYHNSATCLGPECLNGSAISQVWMDARERASLGCMEGSEICVNADGYPIGIGTPATTQRTDGGLTKSGKNDFGNIHHQVTGDFCATGTSYVDCWHEGGILAFEDNEQIDLVQLAELELVIYAQLYEADALSDLSRAVYDTPFWNATAEDTIVCLGDNCAPRSHVNYLAQGAWSARLGQPMATLEVTIRGWKLKEYGQVLVPSTIFEWAEHGYYWYLDYAQSQ